MFINLSNRFRFGRFLLGSLCFIGTVLCCSFPGLQGAQIPEQSGRSFTMRVDVELVTVEVFALDKKGKPIRELKKEDFRLYEDGKQQTIESFDEVIGDATSPAMSGDADEGDVGRGKIVILLFDDSTIIPSHLKPARDSAAKFVSEHMRPQDLFAVASFSLSLKILQNFTRERGKILKAIDLPAVSSASPPRQDLSVDRPPAGDSRQWPDSRSSGARLENMGTGHQAENLLRALDALSVSIEHLKGQKSVLLYSESSFFSPDTMQTIYSRTLSSAKRSNVVFYTVDPGGLSSTIGELQIPNSGRKTAASSYRLSPNSMVNSMFQQQGGGTGGGTGGGSSGGTGGTGGSTGGVTGGSTGGGTGGSTGGSPGTTSGSSGSAGSGSMPGSSRYPGSTGYPGLTNTDGSVWDSGSRFKQQSILKSLASDTGGLSIYNTNNYDAELDKLDQQLSNYYILGFQSNNPKHDGQFRKLEVKTDRKGVTLKYRKSYLDRRPVDLLASSKQEKTLLNAMASPNAATQIPIVFRAAYFYDSPRLARVVVSTKIRMGKVALKKKGGELASALNVMGVAYGEDGSVSARFSEILQISIDRNKEQDFRKSRLSYRNYLKLRPGKYRLKLAASDEADNLGSVEQPFEVPQFPENGIAGSSLVLAEDVLRLPDLIQNLQTRLLDDNEPLLYSGMQILPSVENKLPVGALLPVFFKIYRSAPDNRAKLVAQAKLISESGEERLLPSIPLDENISRSSAVESTVGLRLPFEGTSPGKYTLMIQASDGVSPQPLTVQTDLEIVKE
jgi:VWFA-related protein